MMTDSYDREISRIKDYDSVYIYGAGDVAREVFFSLSQKPYDVKVDAFIVSSIGSSPPAEIEGIPVKAYDDGLNKDGLVVLAVLEKYRDEICSLLDEINMSNRIIMTFESDLWSYVRSKSFEKHCKEKGYPFEFGLEQAIDNSAVHGDAANLEVYINRSIKDRPLKTTYKLRNWEKEIYGGAALDDAEIEGIRDDTGKNISAKNRKYCELTSMFWIWKNTKSEYVGLSHYRRRFDFSNEQIRAISCGSVDAIVTTPVINVPSVEYMYGKNHDIKDWDVMKDVVKRLAPDYCSALEAVGSSNYYIPYNMFIMRRTVFDSYCSWLFPILEECEKVIGDKEDIYQNRYVGFLAERLMSAYLLYHKDDYKIVFCNKIFLE